MTVGLLRQNLSDLTDAEQAEVRRVVGEHAGFVRLDPTTAEEHLELCREHNIDIVLLPKDRPIPSRAMEEGIMHFALTPDGAKELVRLDPILEPL